MSRDEISGPARGGNVRMENSKLERLCRGIEKINTFSASLCGLTLLFVTFSIFVDVFLRYFFNRPSIWITEVSTYLFLYIIFLGTSYALQTELHIRVNFLLTCLPAAWVRWIEVITSVLCIVFVGVLLWQSTVMTWTAHVEQWTTPTMLGLPNVWIYASMVIGSGLLLITMILRTALHFMSRAGQ
jgi:TRAP-type C4-dicarboxylate transport system permease small subunit